MLGLKINDRTFFFSAKFCWTAGALLNSFSFSTLKVLDGMEIKKKKISKNLEMIKKSLEEFQNTPERGITG